MKKATGLPDGTFKHNDPHPTIDGQFFKAYIRQNGRVYERWVSAEKMREIALDSMERKRVKRLAKRGRLVAQRTELPRGTFSAGDPHPWQIGLCFNRYEEGRERWQTDEARRVSILASSRYFHEKRATVDPSERKLLNQVYLYRERLSKCLGIEFHVDHTTPISLGGKHTMSNLEVVPASWNEAKSNRHCDRWMP